MYPGQDPFERPRPHVMAADANVAVAFSAMAAFALLIGLLRFSPWFAFALPLSAYALGIFLTKADHYGLAVSVLITISLSYYFYLGQIPGLVTIIRFAIIGLLAVRLLKGQTERSAYNTPLVFLALFMVTAAIGSFFNSLYVNISELKLLFAGAFFFGLIRSAKASDGFPSILFGLNAGIISLSALFFVFYPVIGYSYLVDPNAAISATGRFSGVLNHPQLLACFVAVNLPLILYAYLTKSGGMSTLAFITTIGASLLIAVSSSRTGLLAVFVGLFSILLMMRKNHDMNVRRRTNLVWGIIWAAILLTLATSFEEVQQFIYKTDDIAGGLKFSGRDEIIYASWQAFISSPIFGNGFQVPSNFTEHGGATFGISSDVTSVEKCFFITMLLEEVGLVGTFLFLAAIIAMLRVWHRKGAYVAIAAMLAFLTINIGEACILSPSSIGGLCWLSIFAVHNLTFRPNELGPGHGPHRRGLY